MSGCGNWFACQSNGPDTIDARGVCAFRMAIAYVFFQMVPPLEKLLPVVKGAVCARVTLVLVCGPMPKESVSPCVRFPARRFRTSPSFVRDSFGVLVQLSKVSEQLVALLAHVALLIVFARTIRLGRRVRSCRARLLLELSVWTLSGALGIHVERFPK
jgi:hypothetical protein